MYIAVNYVAVIVAAIANMVIGFIWYGPIFGKTWVAMMGWTPEQIGECQKKGMTKSYVIAIIGSLITALVLAELLVMVGSYLGLTGVLAGLKAAFIGWLGFVVPVALSGVAWEGKPWKLWFLNVGYSIVSLMVMGAILGSWM